MSDDQFIVNPEHRDITMDGRTRRTLRPVSVLLAIESLVVLAGALVYKLAPDTFAALGGWVIVVAIIGSGFVLASYLTVRRMNAGAVRPDKTSA